MSKLRHVITMLSLGGYTSQDAYNMVETLKEVDAETDALRTEAELLRKSIKWAIRNCAFITSQKTLELYEDQLRQQFEAIEKKK
jgi:hypothetical protein